MPPTRLAVASSSVLEQLAISPTATMTFPEGGLGGRCGAQPKARSIARRATMITGALLPTPRPPSACQDCMKIRQPREIPDCYDPDHAPEPQSLHELLPLALIHRSAWKGLSVHKKTCRIGSCIRTSENFSSKLSEKGCE